MFDETSPQMLTFDGCSSGQGDLGMAGGGGDWGILRRIRRRGQVCRPETGIDTGTQGALEPPTSPDPERSPTPPDDQKNNNAPDPLNSFPYMPPPSLDGLGCGDVGEQIFTYTVCGSKSGGAKTPSTLLDFRLPTFSVTNAELSKYSPELFNYYHVINSSLSPSCMTAPFFCLSLCLFFSFLYFLFFFIFHSSLLSEIKNKTPIPPPPLSPSFPPPLPLPSPLLPLSLTKPKNQQ